MQRINASSTTLRQFYSKLIVTVEERVSERESVLDFPSQTTS